jgi:hypothetical protein
MRSLILTYAILLSTCLTGCDVIQNKRPAILNIFDTLRFQNYPFPDQLDQICLKKINSYQQQFGIVISKYYEVTDKLPIDLNNDGQIDTLIIVTPLSLHGGDTICNLLLNSNPKRLLVEVINRNGRSIIRRIYSNLISDIGGVLSPYYGIFRTKEGFKIEHRAGAKYSWKYSINFSLKKDSFTLASIIKTCSVEGNEVSAIYHFNDVSPFSINVPDTLINQANCDDFWEPVGFRKRNE